MFHQILCALQGKTGTIIQKQINRIAVNSSVNFLVKPQIEIINEICKCGYYYNKIVQLSHSEVSENFVKLTFQGSSSIYRKAMYQGLKSALQQYIDLILQIEQQFLKNRHFTLANLRAELQPYQLIMKQIFQIISHIHQKKLKGGSVINYLYHKYQNSNSFVQKWLKLMMLSTIKVFLNQVNMWILYGQIQDIHGQFFIHKVLTQISEKYQFKSKTAKNIEITDWDMYTLQENMIPKSLIQLQTASKILFIGKSIKILRSANKISVIPDDLILEKINQSVQGDFSQTMYEGTIEQIRQFIAKQMIVYIMKQQNLIKQLEKLNDYYLMFKGDFYHHFFEETKGIESISQKQKAQKKINEIYLPNTFLRLGNNEDIKRLYFEIKTLGFSYTSFRNFTNLCPVGNIDLIQGKSIRFNSTGSSIWNRSKQIIENNFTMICSFRFQKIKNLSTIYRHQSKDPTQLSLVIQNSKEISGSVHESSTSLSKISQYIAVKMGFQFSQKQQNFVSSLMLVHKDIKKAQKQQLLGLCSPKGINFLDEKNYQLKVSYSNQTLKAEIIGQNGENGQVKVQNFRLNTNLQLEMGRSYLGFLSTINQTDFSIDLTQWEMICKPSAFYNSHWSDLSLNFKVQWPINLIITQDLLEFFGRIHKFLFPIRQVQIQLESIWSQIPKFIKGEKRPSKQQAKQLKIFEKKLSALRSEMNLVINNFWAYFHSDIAQILWNNLLKSIQVEKDFERVISIINHYVKSIQIMFYFNTPKIHRKINELIEKARGFTIFFKNILEQNNIDEDVYNELQKIDMQFSQKLDDFYKSLKDMSKVTTSQHLYHMTKRIESCLTPTKTQITV